MSPEEKWARDLSRTIKDMADAVGGFAELGRQLGMTRGGIYLISSGRRTRPQRKTQQKIRDLANTLGIPHRLDERPTFKQRFWVVNLLQNNETTSPLAVFDTEEKASEFMLEVERNPHPSWGKPMYWGISGPHEILLNPAMEEFMVQYEI